MTKQKANKIAREKWGALGMAKVDRHGRFWRWLGLRRWFRVGIGVNGIMVNTLGQGDSFNEAFINAERKGYR